MEYGLIKLLPTAITIPRQLSFQHGSIWYIMALSTSTVKVEHKFSTKDIPHFIFMNGAMRVYCEYFGAERPCYNKWDHTVLAIIYSLLQRQWVLLYQLSSASCLGAIMRTVSSQGQLWQDLWFDQQEVGTNNSLPTCITVGVDWEKQWAIFNIKSPDYQYEKFKLGICICIIMAYASKSCIPSVWEGVEIH